MEDGFFFFLYIFTTYTLSRRRVVPIETEQRKTRRIGAASTTHYTLYLIIGTGEAPYQ